MSDTVKPGEVGVKRHDDPRVIAMRNEIDEAVRGVAAHYPDLNFGVTIGVLDFLAGFYTGTALAYDDTARDEIMISIHNVNYYTGLAAGKQAPVVEASGLDRSKLN